MGSLGRVIVAVVAVCCALAPPARAQDDPKPGTPAFVQRDLQNVVDAYGRQLAPGGQLRNPHYLAALPAGVADSYTSNLTEILRNPLRPPLTLGAVFPGWDMANPLRQGWEGTRGLREPVEWEGRHGNLLRGDVWAPRPGARDPYTGRKLKGPFPGVVITTGSIQGSNRMYWWLAQDLAERGYVVLTYDVQGQGSSETLPHPCSFDGCPGVPAQQEANFVEGTEDAIRFFLSKDNPYGRWFDRRKLKTPTAPGRTRKLAIVGHSLGGSAVSKVQGTSKDVSAVVALDKLQSDGAKPVVPALAVQSEYGFTVAPYFANGGIVPGLGSPAAGPDPQREKQTGFDAWKKAGVDAMLVVPRASTHLEYTDIALALPASRYGQDLTSVYTQRWLDRYLKGRSAEPLFDTRFSYLEPVGAGRWEPVALNRDELLSFYYCSTYAVGGKSAELC
jgi:alpha-beta hydrolase superfamily lysophospholipase